MFRVAADAAALASLAALIGFACGSSMPRPRSGPALASAGTRHDDGSGFLARASGELSSHGLMQNHGEPPAGAEDSDGGLTYGGAAYGGVEYGGTRYGGYRFKGKERWASLPRRTYGWGYEGDAVTRAGSVHGRVVWPKPPRVASSIPIRAPDCPSAIPNDSVRTDNRGNVHGAVVYLDDIDKGRYGVMEPTLYLQKMQIGGLLRQRDCRFIPHVQVVSPVGSVLRLLNEDESEQSRIWTGSFIAGNRTFRAAVPRFVRKHVALPVDGFLHIRDDHSPASAWVVVAGHPYYTVTDAQGQFHLDDVPPGTYTLVTWHEPVAHQSSTGPITLGQPIVHKTRITIKDGKVKRVTVRLPAVR